MDWLYTVSGFLVGLIVGVTGVGGGSLMTPLLVLFFGVSPATAVGTDLLYASITKSLGGWVHSRNGSVDWKVVGLLSLGSLPAALITVALLKYLALDEKTLRSLVTSVLSVALLLTATALLLKEWIKKIALREDGTVYELHHRHLPARNHRDRRGRRHAGDHILHWCRRAGHGGAAVPVPAPVGGEGGGHRYRPRRTAYRHRRHGTYGAGYGELRVAGQPVAGFLPGIYLGSHLSAKVPEKVLRPILATMLLIIGTHWFCLERKLK